MYGIGKLSAATGVKVPTIRYYEEIGLLPEAERSAGNQRRYGERVRERLSFIRHARDLGFPLDAIRDLLSLSDAPDTPCAAADRIVETQLAEVEARIARLEALRSELRRMLDHGEHGGDHGAIRDCRVIEILGDHSLCLHDHHAPRTDPDPTAP